MRTTKRVAFTGPSITDIEINHVIDAVKNGWYDDFNKHVLLLEEEVQKKLSTQHCLATHCGTVALHLATASLGLKEGDEVIVPDFSYVATSYAIDYVKATPVFVDIEPRTWCLDPESVEKAITPKTKALLPVHTYGNPANMDALMSIAKRHSLAVIEDAAPALGSKYKGRPVGTFGNCAIFSFNGTKIAVSGEGGCIVTDDASLFSRIESLASMGRKDSKIEFWSEELGFQYCMGNMSAAVALGQVQRIDELVKIKRQLFSWYQEFLGESKLLELQTERENCFSNWSYPSLLLKDSVRISRDEIVKKLRTKGLWARATFPQMSLFPPHQKNSIVHKNPNAKKLSDRGICLPTAANIKAEDAKLVCEELLTILKGAT